MQIEDWLAVLQCPMTGTELRRASTDELALLKQHQQRKTLLNGLGRPCSFDVEDGLVDLRGRWFYPVVKGVPWMIAEEAIEMAKLVKEFP